MEIFVATIKLVNVPTDIGKSELKFIPASIEASARILNFLQRK